MKLPVLSAVLAAAALTTAALGLGYVLSTVPPPKPKVELVPTCSVTDDAKGVTPGIPVITTEGRIPPGVTWDHVHPTPDEAGYKKPAHVGEKPKERIDWDLSGIWNVTKIEALVVPAYFPSPPKSDYTGRWEAKWVLMKTDPKVEWSWKDIHGQGRFDLGREMPQTLRWATGDKVYWLSINRQSFGSLEMSDQYGDSYHATRSD